MELPPALQAAVTAVLDGVPLADLTSAAETLSLRYRGEVRDGQAHLAQDMAAKAYLATRLPATYAAILAVCDAVARSAPAIAPRSHLDFGAGPGTAMWAALHVWPGIEATELVETSRAIRNLGESLAQAGALSARWNSRGLKTAQAADIVTAGYVINEIDLAHRPGVIADLWTLTRAVLIIVEPGTTAGWRRILAVRDQVLRLGGHILAPCPHAKACPLVEPDWCHFYARVARSRLHRQAKGATVGWEDEKFHYLALSREPFATSWPRILSPPKVAKGNIQFKLCRSDGAVALRTVSKREGDLWRTARRLDWGDSGPV